MKNLRLIAMQGPAAVESSPALRGAAVSKPRCVIADGLGYQSDLMRRPWGQSAVRRSHCPSGLARRDQQGAVADHSASSCRDPVRVGAGSFRGSRPAARAIFDRCSIADSEQDPGVRRVSLPAVESDMHRALPETAGKLGRICPYFPSWRARTPRCFRMTRLGRTKSYAFLEMVSAAPGRPTSCDAVDWASGAAL